MRHVVRGVFDEPAAAQDALERLLRHGVRKECIAFRSRYVKGADGRLEGPGNAVPFDAVGGAVLAGKVLSTPSSTGLNLAGNSSLVDLELGDIGRLLAAVAEQEARLPRLRIDVAVQAPDLAAAERVRSLLAGAGARSLRVRPAEP